MSFYPTHKSLSSDVGTKMFKRNPTIASNTHARRCSRGNRKRISQQNGRFHGVVHERYRPLGVGLATGRNSGRARRQMCQRRGTKRGTGGALWRQRMANPGLRTGTRPLCLRQCQVDSRRRKRFVIPSFPEPRETCPKRRGTLWRKYCEWQGWRGLAGALRYRAWGAWICPHFNWANNS